MICCLGFQSENWALIQAVSNSYVMVSMDNDTVNNFRGYLACKFPCFRKYCEITLIIIHPRGLSIHFNRNSIRIKKTVITRWFLVIYNAFQWGWVITAPFWYNYPPPEYFQVLPTAILPSSSYLLCKSTWKLQAADWLRYTWLINIHKITKITGRSLDVTSHMQKINCQN